MNKRLKLQKIFENILENKHVYFQPPEGMKLEYPCIIYKKAVPSITRADNRVYTLTPRYEVTIVDKNPESTIPYSILNAIESSSIDRYFVTNNLNHTIMTVFY